MDRKLLVAIRAKTTGSLSYRSFPDSLPSEINVIKWEESGRAGHVVGFGQTSLHRWFASYRWTRENHDVANRV